VRILEWNGKELGDVFNSKEFKKSSSLMKKIERIRKNWETKNLDR
jgi:hypothetical protein